MNRDNTMAARVWIVDAYRAGEQTQLRALAEALALPWERKSLHYRKREVRTNLFRGRDLHGVDRSRSDPLGPPWPELVLSAGMRNEPVCRWIRDQSGGRTRIVFVGRLWADPKHFDLVITTPQYRMPDRPNVLRNDLPLHRVHPGTLAAAAEHWAPRLAHLPRPYITVNMGGNSGPYAFGRHAAQRLVRDAVALARARGGSLLVSSSARTRPVAIDAFAARHEVPMQLYRWQRNDPDNPYLGFLALADELIITADSISMLSEAYATGKPVHMFDLGAGRFSMRRDMHLAAGDTAAARAVTQQEAGNRCDIAPGMLAYRALMRWGWKHLSRDISRVHLELIRAGKMAWLGTSHPGSQAHQSSDMQRALARVRALLETVPA
ncbi:MAG TPA: ELM1/GtrOC1 family putative glycosyltransferase [Thiohalobacter sp.]|nr:ELM1/GtrOC1 family putative glycosyltransferase [Thiohalobacter sp.]